MFFGPTMLLLIPGIIFAIWAQVKVRSTFKKYSKVTSINNVSGSRAAREILDAQGLSDIGIEEVPGKLTDHYDPRARVLRLSSGVYRSRSLAALGVAAHEAGHAIQHARRYAPIMLRTGIFPLVALGSNLWFFIFLAGFIFHNPVLINVGVLFFASVVVFSIITLPVEFNASSRAMALLTEQGIVEQSEVGQARAVLNAAALTYLAATLMAILQLLRLILLRRSMD